MLLPPSNTHGSGYSSRLGFPGIKGYVYVAMGCNPCQLRSRGHNIVAHERRTSLPARAVGGTAPARERGAAAREGHLLAVSRARRPLVVPLAAAARLGSSGGRHRNHEGARRAWWTLARHTGVEPTNNGAGRTMRLGILGRRGSFGRPSAAGCRMVEASMTVVATCQPSPRQVLVERTALCAAARGRESAASWLPMPAVLSRLCVLPCSCGPSGSEYG
jgi:hypothetical protein